MRTLALLLAALAVAQLAAAQSQTMSSTLFQSYNATSQQTGFLACNESYPVVGVSPANTTIDGSPMTMLDANSAGQVNVNAIWFGGQTGPALNFQIVGNCSALQLTSNGGHGTTFYTGPVPLAPRGCDVSFYQSQNYLHVFTSITNSGFAWSVSLPTNSSYRAQTACNGGYQYCPLATGLSCDTSLASPTTLLANGSFASPDAKNASLTPPSTPLSSSTSTSTSIKTLG